MKPVSFMREGDGTVYTAWCPWHEPIFADLKSTMAWLWWDLETGMMHCVYCCKGGRMSKPMPKNQLRDLPCLITYDGKEGIAVRESYE